MKPQDVLQFLPQFPGFLSHHDHDGKRICANKIPYGLDDSILGQPYDRHILKEDRPLWHESFRRCRHNREIVDYTVVRLRVPAAPAWLSLQGRMAPFLRRELVEGVRVLDEFQQFLIARQTSCHRG